MDVLANMRVVSVFTSLLIVCGFIPCSEGVPNKLQRFNDRQIVQILSQKPWVLINFWATWCEPCAKELPELIQLSRIKNDLHIVGVSMDDLENEGAVKKYIRRNSIPYDIVLRTGNDFPSLKRAMHPEWRGSIPATFLFRNGICIFWKTGPLEGKEILKEINAFP